MGSTTSLVWNVIKTERNTDMMTTYHVKMVLVVTKEAIGDEGLLDDILRIAVEDEDVHIVDMDIREGD